MEHRTEAMEHRTEAMEHRTEAMEHRTEAEMEHRARPERLQDYYSLQWLALP
jgi:hypothetical protein